MTSFLAFNHTLCRKLDRVWPYPLAASFWDSYSARASVLAARADPAVVVDIGAGRTTPYRVPKGSCELIGLDLLREDLEANDALSQRVVANIVSDGIPSQAKGAGLVTSRMVLEHVPDLERLAREIHDSLAPGGWTIHLFAARYSLFAILNRLLPESVAHRILFTLRPESTGVGGFATYYDHTSAPAAESVFRDGGMTNLETEVSYQVSQYFHFFFPLFILMRIWETLLDRLNFKSLASFVLLQARRPASPIGTNIV
jgi:SAM-dependent methyltransferase